MATFPQLRTGAVAQYPASRGQRFQNQLLRFVDGTDQRYRDSAGPLHNWVIRLELLDERELATLEAFFVANKGRLGNFAFTDPWDGHVYSSCRLASDELDLEVTGELRGSTALKVSENRR